MYNWMAPLPFHQLTSGTVECENAARDRQTDTQTAVANIYFASATPHAKCKYQNNPLSQELLEIFQPNLARRRRTAFYAIFNFTVNSRACYTVAVQLQRFVVPLPACCRPPPSR